tara:strand:- start:953 stop:2305 length:1353 start_codon:yes stop_codon:yes gene_type:complete
MKKEITNIDQLSRTITGYMGECDWSDYQRNLEECISKFGKEDVETYLRLKNIENPVEELDIEEVRDIYERIKQVLQTYMDLKQEDYHIITLWIIGTYIYEEFNTFPLLFLHAVRGSGKTRLLGLLEELCFNGKIEANLSEAVLFRIKKNHTLLLDEFERIGTKEMGTLRELINASYKKGSRVERLKEKKTPEGGKEYVPETFDLYSPLAMANIWGMDETVQDRCITIQLDRTDNPLMAKLLQDFDTNQEIQTIKCAVTGKKCSLCSVVSLKNTIQGWNNYILKKYKTTQTTYTTTLTLTTLTTQQHNLFEKIDEIGVYGRELELYFPLLILSDILGDDLFKKTLEIAKKKFEEKNNEEYAEDPNVVLLEFLWNNYYKEESLEYIPILKIHNNYQLNTSHDKEADVRTTGRALKRLNIVLDKKRSSEGVKVMLDFPKIKEKLKRYNKVLDK